MMSNVVDLNAAREERPEVFTDNHMDCDRCAKNVFYFIFENGADVEPTNAICNNCGKSHSVIH